MKTNPPFLPKLLLTVGMAIFVMNSFSQNTWQRIYNIFQTTCTSESCHDADQPTGLIDLSAGEQDVYNALINATPVNPAAAARGYKRVDPGHPYNSYLLKKLGSEFDTDLALRTDEGDRMPEDEPALPDIEIEIVRQWIMNGAPMTGEVVDTLLIEDYYTNNGIPMISKPAKPDSGEGFQMRFGPIFLPPGGTSGEEVEWLKKHKPKISEATDIYQLDGTMNSQSHHFLLFTFNPGGAANESAGLREVGLLNGISPFDGNKDFAGAWQYDNEISLPYGSAFIWDENTWLDFDYHIRNYDNNHVLAADFYINALTRPSHANTIEMKAELVNNAALVLFPGTSTHTYTHNSPGAPGDRHIWIISSHTHQYGVGFDHYLIDENGNRGEHIYDGNFNPDYTFNQGYYDWEHPAIRTFEPLLSVPMSQGIESETVYNNTSGGIVLFGLTTNDEMMLYTYLYTDEELPDPPPAGIGEPVQTEVNMEVAPNPFSESTLVSFNVKESAHIKLEVFNLIGKRVAKIIDSRQPAGGYKFLLNAADYEMTSGIYFVKIQANESKITRKIVVSN